MLSLLSVAAFGYQGLAGSVLPVALSLFMMLIGDGLYRKFVHDMISWCKWYDVVQVAVSQES
jgi:hypothetical protein